MDKAEAKELIKAINGFTKIQQEHNKVIDKLVNSIKENTDATKEIKTRLLTLSTSIDGLKFSQPNVQLKQ